MITPAPVFSEHCGLLPATYCWCVDDDIDGGDGECTQGTTRTWLPIATVRRLPLLCAR